jgi:CelD/BcsL family acetyltransferase involved in cellulose biosynthesis
MTDPAQSARPIDLSRVSWEGASSELLHNDSGIRAEWDRLNAARGGLPFLSANAIDIALEFFGNGTERMIIGRLGHTVIAILLLSPEGKMRWRTFQPSQIPLGAWVASPEVSISTLAESLIKGPIGFCLALSITQVDPRLAPRESDTIRTRNSDYIETGWVEVKGTFEEYWNARGKNLRQNMRKQRRKLEAYGTRTSMKVWVDPDRMAPALSRYGAMESAGWKATRGTAIHATNSQGQFYRRLFEDAALRREAVIYEYFFDDRSVAMDLCLQRNGVLVVMKTTYDESVKQLSPAGMLREEELRQIFDEGRIERVEYYGRLMDWHTKLTDRKRTLYHLTTYRWPFIRKLLGARRRGAAGSAESDVLSAD